MTERGTPMDQGPAPSEFITEHVESLKKTLEILHQEIAFFTGQGKERGLPELDKHFKPNWEDSLMRYALQIREARNKKK